MAHGFGSSLHRGALMAFVLLGLACGDDTGPLVDPDDDRPNILLITADDLGAPYLSAYGESRIATPNLDALAADGIRFDTAWTTQASCSPSRASLFTGLYPHANGQYGLRPSGFSIHPELESQTLPVLLREAGYRTGVVGKVHVGLTKEFAFDFSHQNVDETRDVALVARRVEEFVGADDSRPFFMMVNYSDPHAFLDGDGRWYFPPQVDGFPEQPIGATADTLFDFQGVDSDEQRERVANYLNAVLRLDVGIGMVMAQLDALGVADDTLVIFVGDHGPPFERGKTTVYDAGLRVPLMVRWPGGERGVSRAMVSSVDIMPTIVEAADIELPEPLHGRSLLPLVRGEPYEAREYLAGEFHFHTKRPFVPRRAIRDQAGHKLIHNLLAGRTKPKLRVDQDIAWDLSREARYDGTIVRTVFDTHADPPEFELYDLSSDPVEFHNLADDPASAEDLDRLLKALERWREDSDDPFLDDGFLEQMLVDSMSSG